MFNFGTLSLSGCRPCHTWRRSSVTVAGRKADPKFGEAPPVEVLLQSLSFAIMHPSFKIAGFLVISGLFDTKHPHFWAESVAISLAHLLCFMRSWMSTFHHDSWWLSPVPFGLRMAHGRLAQFRQELRHDLALLAGSDKGLEGWWEWGMGDYSFFFLIRQLVPRCSEWDWIIYLHERWTMATWTTGNGDRSIFPSHGASGVAI